MGALMALLTDFLLTELLIELGRWWSDMCLAAGSNGFNSLTYLLTYILTWPQVQRLHGA